jgi:hypothetical protein
MAKSPKSPSAKSDLEKMLEHLKSPAERLEQHLEESSSSYVLKKMQEAADPAGAMLRRMEESLDPAAAALRRIEQGDPASLAAKLLSSGPDYGGALKPAAGQKDAPETVPMSIAPSPSGSSILGAAMSGPRAEVDENLRVHIIDGNHRMRVLPGVAEEDFTQPNAIPVARIADGNVRQFDKAVVQLHVRGLIEAFQEVADYHPQRNVPTPPLWKADQGYLDEIKALIAELRRLNDLLEAGNTPDAKQVGESGSAIAYAAKKISDSAYDTLGKGLGYAVLGSLAVLAYQLGASADIVQIIMKGGK